MIGDLEHEFEICIWILLLESPNDLFVKFGAKLTHENWINGRPTPLLETEGANWAITLFIRNENFNTVPQMERRLGDFFKTQCSIHNCRKYSKLFLK